METKLIKGLCFLVLFAVSSVFGQTSFYKIFSGNGYDKGQGIVQLEDSSFTITGSSSSFDEAASQAFLLHIDKFGNYDWSLAYGGLESEEGRRVMVIENEAYLVAGTSSSGPSTNFDAYVFKTDISGTLLWERFLDFGSWERVNDAILLADSSVLITGQTDSAVSGNNDIILMRIDKNGSTIWSKKLGTEGEDVGLTLEYLDANTFLLGGTMYNQDSLTSKGFVSKFNIDGTEIWSTQLGKFGTTKINDIFINNTTIFAIGETLRYNETEPGDYTARLDLSGILTFDNEFDIDYTNRNVAGIVYEAGGGNTFFGVTQLINEAYPTYDDGEDFIVSRYNFGFFWDNYGVGYNDIGQDQVNQMIPTSDGYGVLVGFSSGAGYGGSSVFVVKIGNDNAFPSNTQPPISNIVTILENTISENLRVAPNPFNDALNIDLKGQSGTYELFNGMYALVHEGEFSESTSVETSELTAGIYFLRLKVDGKEAVCKLIKH